MIDIQNHLRNRDALNLFDRAASKVERQMLTIPKPCEHGGYTWTEIVWKDGHLYKRKSDAG